MRHFKVTFSYVLTTFLAVFMTWILHEFAHWATSKLLGYEAMMSLNKSGPVGKVSMSKGDHMLISAAGPIITILQAMVVCFLLQRNWNKHLYPIVFIPFYMRLLAGIMNVFKANDEGRISEYFGIGLYTLSIVVSGFLFYLVYSISKKHELTKKFNLYTTLLVMLFSSLLILGNQFFQIRLL